ncbi:tetratricopeptide repeat protein [Dactylosporangium salmoneum]|uniref:Anaphase-promoting complex subunit 5 domain-containing protein n=1 Tax=Dactylosporangium salmoneum TaxID=53361 RepID=A0ABN3FKE7_9ACTN
MTADDDPLGQATALINLAETRAAAGEPGAALAAVDEAGAEIARIPDEGDRKRLLAVAAAVRVAPLAATEGEDAAREAVVDAVAKLRAVVADHVPTAPFLLRALAQLVAFEDRAGRPGEALQAVAEEVAVRQWLVGRDAGEPDELPSAVRGLARRLVAQGRTEDAVLATIESLEVLGAAEEEGRAARADQLDDLAGLHAALGRTGEAIRAAEESVAQYRALVGDRPAALADDHSAGLAEAHSAGLAGALLNLGTLLARQHRGAEAEAVTAEAVEAFRELGDEDNLAAALDNHGNRLAELGREPEAIERTREAVRIRAALAAERPDPYAVDFARSLGNLATRLMAVDPGEALATYGEAIERYRRAPGPRDERRGFELAAQLTNYAAVLRLAGRDGEAVVAAREAVELLAPLAAASPALYHHAYLQAQRMVEEPGEPAGPRVFSPPAEDPQVPEAPGVRLVRGSALLTWTAFKESRQLEPGEYVDLTSLADVAEDHRLICVSHRWMSPAHPDPDGRQLRELQGRLRELPGLEPRQCLVFFDFAAVPQRPRTAAEDAAFRFLIARLDRVFQAADMVLVLSGGYTDYRDRSWCFLELVISERNRKLFADQRAVADDLAFMGILGIGVEEQLGVARIVTSYDFRYKRTASQALAIAAILAHLDICRTSRADDRHLVRQMMFQYFWRQRLSPYSKMILALHRHFDVSFGLLTPDGFVAARPYFEHPDWPRLPPLEPGGLLAPGDGRPNVYATPSIAYEVAEPVLRLSLPGTPDLTQYLAAFQSEPGWRSYVVSAATIALAQGDHFPTARHVVHTLLEKFPPLGFTDDPRYGYLFLLDDDYDDETAVFIDGDR